MNTTLQSTTKTAPSSGAPARLTNEQISGKDLVKKYLVFNTTQEARDYRHENGTGGWIFAPENGGEVVLFPPEMAPTQIFNHQLTKGLSGQLIGAM